MKQIQTFGVYQNIRITRTVVAGFDCIVDLVEVSIQVFRPIVCTTCTTPKPLRVSYLEPGTTDDGLERKTPTQGT